MRVQSQSNHALPLAGACVSWIGLMTAWPTQAPPQSQDPCATNVTNSDAPFPVQESIAAMAYTSNPGRRRRLCHYRKVRLSIVIIEIAKLTAFSVRRRPVPARCSYACLPYGRYSLGSGAVADSACTMMPVTRQPPASLIA